MRAKDLGPQQRSCFCYSPPHGAAIIGIVFFIASTVMSLMLTGLILEWDEIMENFGNERTVDFALPMLIASLPMSVILLVFSVWMLLGLKESKRLYLIPWLFWSTLCLLTFSFASIYGTSIGTDQSAQIAILMCIYVAVCLVWTYEIYCIGTYYTILARREIEEEEEKETVEDAEQGYKKTKWYSVKLPKFYSKSIWEGDNDDDDDTDGAKVYSDEDIDLGNNLIVRQQTPQTDL